jgi:hypothetical protein
MIEKYKPRELHFSCEDLPDMEWRIIDVLDAMEVPCEYEGIVKITVEYDPGED